MKDKVKNPKRKLIVEVYQQQIRDRIAEIISTTEGKMKPSRKQYLEVLEANIKIAPYLLGYLYWPEPKQKKKKDSE